MKKSYKRLMRARVVAGQAAKLLQQLEAKFGDQMSNNMASTVKRVMNHCFQQSAAMASLDASCAREAERLYQRKIQQQQRQQQENKA